MTVLGVLRECLRFSLTKRKTTKEVALPPSTLCSNARGFSPVIVDKSRIMMRDSYTRVSTEVNPSSASHLFPLGTFSPTVKVVQDKPHPPPKNTPPMDSIRFDSSVDSSSSSSSSFHALLSARGRRKGPGNEQINHQQKPKITNTAIYIYTTRDDGGQLFEGLAFFVSPSPYT